MMKVILIPAGSHGDVHPFVGLGVRLAERGHEVTLATAEPFGELVERSGLQFDAISSTEDFERLSSNPDIWHPRRGPATIARIAILPAMRQQYDYLKEIVDDDTVIIGSALGFGGRLIHEKFGVPFVSLHLQPVMFWSNYDTPLVARGVMTSRWVPKWLKQAQWNFGIWLVWDRFLKKEVNAFRADLGLRPIRSTWEMAHSPQRIIGMFPDWFSPPQPDWPPQSVLTGFPRWDEAGVTEVPSEAETFLASGDPPIVFTPGSANIHGAKFFQAAVGACRQLGRRGMLLTRHAHQVPADLPPDVKHFDYLPFSEVLPRCAALVHHGGIGTLSQALAAGIPHLVMPMAHDQPDNANRLKKLGVGDYLYPPRFTGPRLAAKLDRLLSSPEVAAACEACANRLEGVDALGDTCDVVEQLAIGQRPGDGAAQAASPLRTG